MRLALLTVSTIAAGLLAAASSAQAADMVPLEPPAAYGPPPVAAVPPPVVVERRPLIAAPAPCWRYGGRGWGWYPCVAGPPAYWHDYRYGYGYGYGYRDYRSGYRGHPYWAHARHWHRSYW